MIAGVVEVGKNIEFKNIKNEYEVYSDLVGGYLECVYFPKSIVCVVNEEGIPRGLEFNFSFAYDGNAPVNIYGDCVFVGNNGRGDFCSLNEEQIAYLNEYFFDDVFE